MKTLILILSLVFSAYSIAEDKCDLYVDIDDMDRHLSPKKTEAILNQLEAKGYNVISNDGSRGHRHPNRVSVGYYQTKQVCYMGDASKFEILMNDLLITDLYYFSIRLGDQKFEAERETQLFRLKRSTRFKLAMKVIKEIPECTNE
jgi:hypothetical protein